MRQALRPQREGQQVTVFHLASVMSGEGEADFEKCYRVNVEGQSQSWPMERLKSAC
jgi:hypothetical protein